MKALRLSRGWTQEQLAEICGLNIRTVQRIERGHPPGLESLNCLAATLGRPLRKNKPGPKKRKP